MILYDIFETKRNFIISYSREVHGTLILLRWHKILRDFLDEVILKNLYDKNISYIGLFSLLGHEYSLEILSTRDTRDIMSEGIFNYWARF